MVTKGNGGSTPSNSGNTGALRYDLLMAMVRGAASPFEGVRADMLLSAVEHTVMRGDLISFARTTDGGAICVTILSGEGKWKVYANGFEELEAIIEQLAELA